MRWIYITMEHATFALGVRDGVVVAGPPIAKYQIGRPEQVVADHYRRQGAKFSDLWFESS